MRTAVHLGPTLARLSELFELDPAELQKMVKRWPTLVGHTRSDSLMEKLAYVQERLELSDEQLRRLLVAYPHIVNFRDMRIGFESKLALFEAELSVSTAELRKLIMSAPSITSTSNGKLLLRLRFLREALSLERDKLRRLVLGYPSVVCLGEDTKLVPALRFLRERLGLEVAEQGRMVVAKPQLLSYRVDNLEAKIAFFERELGATPEEIREAVVTSPPILGMSISQRFHPRLALLREKAGGERVTMYTFRTFVMLPNRRNPKPKAGSEPVAADDCGEAAMEASPTQ
jgi:mTERF domain-containing protein